MSVNFNKFSKFFSNYTDFALAVNSADDKTKGDISEEYWRRWLHYTPYVNGFIEIHNANNRSSQTLLHKFPELSVLKVGTPNSALVDIVIEYTDGYDLVSCKWWKNGLNLKEIGAFFTITNQHFPSLKTKYLTTTAPRTSSFAIQLGNLGKNVVILYEQEFAVSDDVWIQILNHKKGSTPKFQPWLWRNYRESKTYRKMTVELWKNKKAKFQGPPGWGKTQLMFMLDKTFWLRDGGMTICMSDGVTVLKQNFSHYNTQYQAHKIYRPSLVICRGADDESLVDWPVEIVGNEPSKILDWMLANPNGMIFCFYGNTKALEQATQAYLQKFPKFQFTFAACDEASRTCQPEGSGWSHILYDHRIPVGRRAFLDATPRIGKKIGMDNDQLYGDLADVVSQAESEDWGSTTGFYIKGMILKTPRLQKQFKERRFIKGKSYTVEDRAMAVALLQEKTTDANDHHTISFGVKIERLNQLKDAINDARFDLIKKNPKKYKGLDDIEVFVADTNIHSTSDIHNKLEYIYKKKSRSIVFTSRLLYRGWSQVKLDSVHFSDNFKGISYIIQALGRGLRKNKDKVDKTCKIIVPVDIANSKPWDHLLSLIDSLSRWDFRPVEAILALKTKPRGMAVRKPQNGGVVINTSGVQISISSLLKNLGTAVSKDFGHWEEEKQYISDVNSIATDYINIDKSFYGYLRDEQSETWKELEKRYPTYKYHHIYRIVHGKNSFVLPQNLLALTQWAKKRLLLASQAKEDMKKQFIQEASRHISLRDNVIGQICKDIGAKYNITSNIKMRISQPMRPIVDQLKQTVILNNQTIVKNIIKNIELEKFNTGPQLIRHVTDVVAKQHNLIVNEKFVREQVKKIGLGKTFKSKGSLKRKSIRIKANGQVFNSISDCAKHLGITRQTIYTKIKNKTFTIV